MLDAMEVFLPVSTAWFWFILAVLFIVIEVFTFALTTIWFAVGALVLVFVSFLPIPFIYQVIIFLAISVALLVLTRPIFLKKLQTRREKTNVDRFAGMVAVVTKTITPLEKGEIKADGTVWTAKLEGEVTLEQGSECIIVRIEGVSAVVVPKKI